MQAVFLEGLDEVELHALIYLFEYWALPHQLPPDGDWRTWIVMGGRGAGKTRAGAEWVRSQVEGNKPKEPGRAQRVALVGETYQQARDVMVLGESGILACTPPDRRPNWKASERKLVWPNGSEAHVFSARSFEAMRGPQFDAAWADELAKWPKAGEAWDMLQFGLRLGEAPQAVVTTTPRNVEALKEILNDPATVMTHAPTRANKANLAESFITHVEERYSGTRQGAQELDGVLIDHADGSLWPPERLQWLDCVPEDLIRVVVGVDPATTGNANSDECGIVVVAAYLKEGRECAVVLEDASVSASSPTGWARAAVAAYHRNGADRIIAEVNQGGDLVETVIRQVDENVSFAPVFAKRGKVVRAEPVAALYEQGRVSHVRGMPALERQMAQMTRNGFEGQGSPDRVDALVWALSNLMLRKAPNRPRVRSL